MELCRQHWPALSKQMGGFAAGAIVRSTGAVCSTDMRQQVQGFFANHQVAAAERTLRQALDQMKKCIDLDSQQAPQLATWLQRHGTASGE